LVVDLHDAVAVYRDYNGKLRVDQSYQMTRWVVNIEAGFIRSKGQGLLASCPILTTTSRRDVRIQILAALSVTAEIYSMFTTHLGGHAVLPRCARHGDHLWRRRRYFFSLHPMDAVGWIRAPTRPYTTRRAKTFIPDRDL
jgi:hypothetical protein